MRRTSIQTNVEMLKGRGRPKYDDPSTSSTCKPPQKEGEFDEDIA
jgi:hypothetical protein